MRKTFWYILGGQLATISIPALAQDTSADPAHDGSMAGEAQSQYPSSADKTADQMKMQDWPADKQMTFEAWPENVKSYYWTLSEPRQDVFWRLNDNDKLALVELDEAGREQAWTMIERRVAAEAANDATQPEQPVEAPEPEGR